MIGGLASASTSERDERTKPITTNEKIFFNVRERALKRRTLLAYAISLYSERREVLSCASPRMREKDERRFWTKLLNQDTELLPTH